MLFLDAGMYAHEDTFSYQAHLLKILWLFLRPIFIDLLKKKKTTYLEAKDI